MANRLVRWFTYTVAFALVPLFTTVLLRYVHGSLVKRNIEDSPEVLFFTLMVCATALGDINELRAAMRPDGLLQAISSALLMGASISAILYGSFAYDKIASGGTAQFQERLFGISVVLALTFLLLGTLLQVLLGRTKGTQP